MGIVDQTKERERLAVLRRQNLMDSPPDASLHSVVARAADVMMAPGAAFSLVDERRVWLKERVGIPFQEISRDDSFCTFTVSANEPQIVENAATSSRYDHNRYVIGTPYIRFYAGVPVRASTGHVLGALFVQDSKPRTLSLPDVQLALLESLAREIELYLACHRLQQQLYAVAEERAMLSESLVHEVGSTAVCLGSLANACRDDSESRRVAERCRHVSERLHELSSAVMRVGDPRSNGIPVNRRRVELHSWFELFGRRVARRLQSHGVELRFSNGLPRKIVTIDAHLLERVVFHVVDHALDASRPGSKILLHGDAAGGRLTLNVADNGPGVPPGVRDRIFEPYFRWHTTAGGGRTSKRLAAGRLAAEALGGSLSLVPRSDSDTEFLIAVPVAELSH